MDNARVKQDQITDYLVERGKISSGEEDDLLKELEELEEGQVVEQIGKPINNKPILISKEDDELEKLKRELDALSLPSDTTSVSSKYNEMSKYEEEKVPEKSKNRQQILA